MKTWNQVVSSLRTRFLYALVKLNGSFLFQSETIADFQINCNDRLIKSQSSIKYLSIDIHVDQNLSDERTVNTII
jgi:hypothetical protein